MNDFLLPAVGLVLGAVLMWIVLSGAHRKKSREFNEKLSGLALRARNLSRESSELKDRVAFLEEKEKDYSDLAVLMPSMVKKIFSARTAGEAAENICRACTTLAGAEQVAIFLADRSGKRLGLDKVHGLSDVLSPPLSVALGDGLVGFAGETGRLVSTVDLEKETAIARQKVHETAIKGYSPEVAVPMEFQGILFGVIGAGKFNDHTGIHRENLRAIGAIGAAALENVRLLERFARTTGLDRDTGLPVLNSVDAILTEELERVYRFGQPMGVVELRLKTSEMHNPGLTREAMVAAANHMKQMLRNIDTCIRFAHDTFLLILPGTSGEGLKTVIGKLGGELPRLSTPSGAKIGGVLVRNQEISPGEIVEVSWVREDLAAREFEEFEGYYGTEG